MSTFALLLPSTFILEAQLFNTDHVGFPDHPIFYQPFGILLFPMYLGGGEGEGQYGRDEKHEPENKLALNCHHTAGGRSEPEN